MKTNRLVVPFECKALADADGQRTFEGYGSVFGGLDSYRDTIAKGAFRSTLREWKTKGRLPKMLLQHGGGFLGGSASDMVPVGQWIEMREDETGLYAKGRLFDSVDPLVYEAMKAGELDGLSIGFRVRKSKMDEETGIRTLTDIDLWELSIVTFPADDSARVSAVKADGTLPTAREFERWLRREAGFTEAQAKAIVAKGYRLVLREADQDSDRDSNNQPHDTAGGHVVAGRQRAVFIAGLTALRADLRAGVLTHGPRDSETVR